MKKLLFALALMVPMIAFVGCQSEVERRANKQMRETINEKAYFPESVKIGKIEKVWQAKNDSSVILHFEVEARKKNGAMDKSYCEYIYLMSEDGDRESLSDLSNKESVIQLAKEGKHEVERKIKDGEKELTIDDYIGLYVLPKVFFNGRKVPNN